MLFSALAKPLRRDRRFLSSIPRHSERYPSSRCPTPVPTLLSVSPSNTIFPQTRFFSEAFKERIEPSSSLGLRRRLIEPQLESLRQLPEIEMALQQWPNSVENIERAVQVFEMMGSGSPLHVAALVLLADCRHQRGDYAMAAATLERLESLSQSSVETIGLLKLAHAKVLWYGGHFDVALEYSKCLAESDVTHASHLARGCAMNAEALSRLLMSATDLEQVSLTRDQLRMTARTLEQGYKETKDVGLALASATAYGNYGVSELVLAGLASGKSHVGAASTRDSALKAWRDGLSVLDRLDLSTVSPESTVHKTLDKWIRTQILCNMTWALLDDKEYLKTASEYASKALSTIEKEQTKLSETEFQQVLGRSLKSVASCYRRADAALTAEGLLHSCTDALGKGLTPQSKLDMRDAYKENALLCRRWEKRERDAEILEEKIKKVNEQLPGSWRGKSSIFSGLCFFTQDIFIS